MANSPRCSVCDESIRRNIQIDRRHSNLYWAAELGVSEASVRRHYKHVAAGEEVRYPGLVAGFKTNTSKTKEQEQGRETFEEASDGSKAFTERLNRKVTMQDARDWLIRSGDNPDDFNLAIKSIEYGKDLYSNKMSAWPKVSRLPGQAVPLDDIDPVAILEQLRQTPRIAVSAGSGDQTFVVSLNDWQTGKDEGGGTPALIKRVHHFVEETKERIEELRYIDRSIGTLVIVGGGDIVEGCVIYPNQSYSIDLTRRGQINTAVALLLYVIDELAPLFRKVTVMATKGNHGENRINGHKTTPYDNDDTLVFEMAQLATSRDSDLRHVEYVIAQDEAGVWVDVSGWRLATTHGDIYGKGVAGASPDKKAQNWMKSMSFGRDPLGEADVLIGHHFHHYRSVDWGSCLFVQTPAQDGGSEYFRQFSGEYSEPGMLTFVMTPEDRYQDEKIIR